MEPKHIYPVLKTRQIIPYYRFADGIIYDENKTNMEQTYNEFNNTQPGEHACTHTHTRVAWPKNYDTDYTNKHALYITERCRNTKTEKEQTFSKY
jgi:hypothetical protein